MNILNGQILRNGGWTNIILVHSTNACILRAIYDSKLFGALTSIEIWTPKSPSGSHTTCPCSSKWIISGVDMILHLNRSTTSISKSDCTHCWIGKSVVRCTQTSWVTTLFGGAISFRILSYSWIVPFGAAPKPSHSDTLCASNCRLCWSRHDRSSSIGSWEFFKNIIRRVKSVFSLSNTEKQCNRIALILIF